MTVLTIEREMKKNVRKKEYSIVISTAFQIGLSFQVICAEIADDSTTINRSKQFNPYLFALSLLVHFLMAAMRKPGRGEMKSEM